MDAERPTRAALDATLWDEPTTGIGLYTRELWSALAALGPAPLRLGARRSGDAPRGRRSRTAFCLAQLPRELSARPVGLYHALGNFNLPLTKPRGVRFVLTVHDLIPELFPQTVSAAFRWQFKLWLHRSVALADRIVCVSEATKRDLVARHPQAEDRATVVHNGVDHVEREGPLDAVGEAYLRTLGLPERFILFAGAWDVRKNLALVLDAWERLVAPERVPLVLAGQSWFGAGAAEARVARMRAQGADVRPVGYQPAPVLYELMRRATVFVFPSLYEGFGLPPLEAMRLGAPTIVSRAGSLPEVCGDAAVCVDPHDASDLAGALNRLLRSPSEREARQRAGQRWAQRFTWASAARQVADIYRSLGVS